MPSDEIHRSNSDNLNNSDDSSCHSNDYSDKRSLPITIPDYSEMTNSNKDKYVVFNIHISGMHLCSRRYKEFDVFHSLLKSEFPDFNFPNLPSKWLFKLSEQQLDARRRGLEAYLDKSLHFYIYIIMFLHLHFYICIPLNILMFMFYKLI
jgi:sorting nexin-27